MKNKEAKRYKKGQITIFIIIAIIIVAAIVAIVIFRGKIFQPAIPSELAPVYTSFSECVKQKLKNGIAIAGSQGGYIEPPEFEPGSEYAPFSSQLDFFGFPVPYWYYVSENNIIKEQVPTKSEIEKQLGNYIENELAYCDFSNFYEEGYVIEKNNPNVDVSISDNTIKANVKMSLTVTKGDKSARKTEHSVEVNSNLGNFYNLAREIYSKEKEEMFLENYAIDVMRLYAPVTDAEISCSPKIWNPQNVTSDLRQALEANILALKLKGNYYTLKNKDNKYFVIDLPVKGNEKVNFLYMKDWPSRIEIWPTENGIMLAKPVGLQQGIGALGFCYVPYHFVYDIYFPVLIQVYDDNEIFQFPVAVVIDKSVARNALPGTIEEQPETEMCNYKNTRIDIYTYNSKLEPVEADISFKCLNTECDIGKTKISGNDAVLSAEFPQCVNGYIIAKADDYLTKTYLISTNSETIADILLDKLYDINLNLLVNGKQTDDLAIITFDGINNFATAAYPEQKTVKLSEGFYNISVQVFSSSGLKISESSTRKCVEVPRGGVLGFFGATSEQCFDITMHGQDIEKALTAGGSLNNEYILESELESGKVEINAPSLPKPTTLEQLQDNYNLLETKILQVGYK